MARSRKIVQKYCLLKYIVIDKNNVIMKTNKYMHAYEYEWGEKKKLTYIW